MELDMEFLNIEKLISAIKSFRVYIHNFSIAVFKQHFIHLLQDIVAMLYQVDQITIAIGDNFIQFSINSYIVCTH